MMMVITELPAGAGVVGVAWAKTGAMAKMAPVAAAAEADPILDRLTLGKCFSSLEVRLNSLETPGRGKVGSF
jgi:hypothetical protein